MRNAIFDLCLHTGQNAASVGWFMQLKKGLEAAGISVMAFSLDDGMGKAWQKQGMHDFIVLPEYRGQIDIGAAAAFAKKLGISNFRSLYQTPQALYNLDEEFCQRKMAAYIHALQSLENVPRARVYWTYGGDEFDHNCFRLLSRMHGGRTIYNHDANMNGRMVFFENEERYWKIPKGAASEPDEQEIQWLKNYIREYIGEKTILWGDPSESDVKWEWSYLLRFIKRLTKSFKVRTANPQSTNLSITRTFLTRVYNRFFSQKYYADLTKILDGKEQFYYFPLHLPIDSQLTLRGKPFMDQAFIVEMVSRYVPYPYTLLVKEHPHARGWSKVAEIKKMAALPNVKLIHPFTNSHDFIPQARGIVVINSSVGYEGILYRKPVITLGRSFYRNQGLTIDVESLYELEQAFEKMETFKITEKEVIAFLWRIKYFSYPSKGGFDLSKENRELCVSAVKDYMCKNNLFGNSH